LFGRLFAATVAVVAVALLVLLALVLRERRELAFTESGSSAAASSIVEVSQQLAHLAPDQRDEMLEQLRAEHPPRRPHDHPHEDFMVAQRSFANEVQSQLGGNFAVAARPPRMGHQRVIMLGSGDSLRRSRGGQGGGDGPPRRTACSISSSRLPDGDASRSARSLRAARRRSQSISFSSLGCLTVMLGGVLYAMTRTITRPLGDLAKAADAVGRGTTIAPLQERGARELKRATRAFNAMQERLNRYLDSRTRVLAAMSHDLRTPITRLRTASGVDRRRSSAQRAASKTSTR
jgi:signal transduction histidine kinase